MNICKVNGTSVCLLTCFCQDVRARRESHANVAFDEKSLHSCFLGDFSAAALRCVSIVTPVLCLFKWSRLVVWSLKKKKINKTGRFRTRNLSDPAAAQRSKLNPRSPSSGWLQCSWWRLSRDERMEHRAVGNLECAKYYLNLWTRAASLFICIGAARTDRAWDGGAAASYCAGIQTAAERRLLSDVCLFFGSGVFAVNVTEAAAVFSLREIWYLW